MSEEREKVINFDRRRRKRGAAGAPPPPGGASEAWRNRLVGLDKTNPKVCLENALIYLTDHPAIGSSTIARDMFSGQVVLRGKMPWTGDQGGPVEPGDDRHAARWMQREGLNASEELAGEAIEAAADLNKFHPVLDYLERLEWDGIHRLDSWLSAFLGAEDSPYTRRVGRCFLIGAVARIYQPGCKADHALILEGEQGILKSTAIETIFRPWFTDDMPDLHSKDAPIALRGVWCVELSELDALERADVARIKAFISRKKDRYRPPYGRRMEEFPRQCVFAGTVNRDTYLRDETGARRFWPVTVSRIYVDALRASRDQLWAEAVAAYRAGEKWWLDDPSLLASARKEQADRYEPDEWEAPIVQYIEGKSSVSIGEILRDALGLREADWDRAAQIRVGKILRTLGWVRKKRYHMGKNRWRYVPSEDRPPPAVGERADGSPEASDP